MRLLFTSLYITPKFNMQAESLRVLLYLLPLFFYFSQSNCPSQSIDFSNNFVLNGNFSGGLLAPWTAQNP